MSAVAAKADGGFDAAVEILYMRLYSLRSDKKPITGEEREIAQMLLAGITFEEKKSREPHMLAEIVEHCLHDPEDAELARGICRKLIDAVGGYKVSGYDYNELITELAAQFPLILLDEAFDQDGSKAESDRERDERFDW